MPEMIPIGWFHLVIGIIALISGVITLFKYKEISLKTRSGQIYLVTTAITAGTALVIFQRGVFGPGHALAVLTFVALIVGFVCEKWQPIGKWSRYLQAISYSGTLLFHGLPAVTDGLMRLPIGDPVITSFEDPILLKCFVALFVAYVIGIVLQLRWLQKLHNNSHHGSP